MFDQFNRNINYLRISVTDRCNLRCSYCMPAEGVPLISHNDILTFEEIHGFIKVAVNFGISKVRITGGEPLVRKGITRLVKMISEVEGINDFAMTTNGILLEEFAVPLKQAGLHRLNISLDTVDPENFRQITRGGDINRVFRGIISAKEAGFTKTRINCVVINSSDEKDAREVSEFCQKHGLEVRFIHMMDLGKGKFTVVEGGSGGDCEKCSRLRLTANGKLKPCLFNDIEYDIRETGYEKAIRLAIFNKPACGTSNQTNTFSNIGG